MRWADLDLLGHVNNVVYVDYLQEARVDMMRHHRGGAPAQQSAQDLVEGLVDEFTLHVAPRLLGGGLRLFDELTPEDLRVEPVGSSASRYATHLDYRIVR